MTVDSMVASTIATHVKEGYRYLMDNYVQGDRICIFGFSRGGHTARVLTAMIHKVGLLPPGNYRHIKYAWELFTLTTEAGWKMAGDFKNAFGIDVDIEFVGIWDSVGSVGISGNKKIPFDVNNTTIKTFRHALSLDERRARFQANVWHFSSDTVGDSDNLKESKGNSNGVHPPNKKERKFLRLMRDNIHVKPKLLKTDVKEVWFAGCHSDVGGGNTCTDQPDTPSLSRISLRWMVRQCFETKSGILFCPNALRTIGLDPALLFPEVVPRPPAIYSENSDNPRDSLRKHHGSEDKHSLTEEELDLRDSELDPNDMLSDAPWWWILEIIPGRKRIQRPDGSWAKTIKMNLGNPRQINCQGYGVNFHRSVEIKMKRPGSQYRPKAKYHVHPIWVV